MMNKRHKLRLRKQVIISIPIALIITLGIILYIVNINHVFSRKITRQDNIEASNELNDVVKLSERDFIVNISSYLEERQKDNTIIYYAQKFKLNVDKTLEIARKMTDDYSNELFKQTFAITKDEYREKVGSFDSFEAGVVYFIRDLYRYPTRYGTTAEEIKASSEIDNNKRIVDGKVYLDNGLTYEQYLGKICDLFGLDKTLALAISYHESGILKSSLFINSNNVAGQRNNTGWLRYTTLEAGIIGYVISLRAMLANYSIDINTDNGLYDLSAIYVNGNLGAGPALSWADKITYFMNRINEQDLFSI